MNKEEYMRRLAEALTGVPQSEKEEALQYYNDYFDDAGVENEQDVMNSLGDPEKLAETIRKEQGGQQDTYNGDSYAEDSYMGTTGGEDTEEKKNKLSGGVIALIVILAILASPIILSLAVAVISAIVGVLAGIFSAIVAIIAVIAALICVAIALIITAIAIGVVSPFGAVVLSGIGIMIAAICVFLIMAVVWLFGVALPWIVKGIIKLFKMMFGKKGGKQ